MPERVVFRGGSVFDGSGAPPFRADVAVEGQRIVEVGSGLAGQRSIDASGTTILPGLIDCHTHIAYSSVLSIEEEVSRSTSYNAFAAVGTLQATLDCGITTVRDAAGADAGFRRAVEDGLVAGPRILVSLMQLSPTGGPNDVRTPSGLDLWADRPDIPRPVADGPDGLRHKVREFVAAGADVIKIFATGHFAMPRDGARRTLFRDGELSAIVDEAARLGVRVMAHAHGADGAAAAARAGAASVEHGFYADERSIAAMRDHGTVFVPTLLAGVGSMEEAAGKGETEVERMATVADGHRRVVRLAHEAGVAIALGTDCPVTPHGRNLEELRLLVDCGLTPAEALRSATSVGASLLGLEREIGRIATGLRADLILIDSDPLDLTDFKARIRDVYRDGRRVGPGLARRLDV